jgi:hypothetical protein
LDVYTNKWTISSIDAPTFHGWQKIKKGLPLSILCSFYKQRVLVGSIESLGRHYFTLGSYGNRRSLSRLGVIIGFSPISMHD